PLVRAAKGTRKSQKAFPLFEPQRAQGRVKLRIENEELRKVVATLNFQFSILNFAAAGIIAPHGRSGLPRAWPRRRTGRRMVPAGCGTRRRVAARRSLPSLAVAAQSADPGLYAGRAGMHG